MIVLSSTTDTIEIVLGGAVTTSQPQFVGCWRDITTTTYTAGRSVTNTNDTTTVTAIAAPAASTQRVVDHISLYNRDTATVTATIKYDDNGTEYILFKGDLATGEGISYANGMWQRYALPALGVQISV